MRGVHQHVLCRVVFVELCSFLHHLSNSCMFKYSKFARPLALGAVLRNGKILVLIRFG